MSLFKGSGVAIVTPFHTDGRVDYETLETLLMFQMENKTDAIIICGSTGEAATLTDDEQVEVIKFTVDKVNKKIPVIAGTGSNDTNHGIELSKKAEEVGADACLLVTPYYNKTSQEGLYRHFKAHADAINIPIILYNVPSRTGLNINPETALRLSETDNIVGIKEASGNMDQIVALSQICRGKLDIYSGNDNEIIPILALGGIGVISVVANITPKETHELVYEYLEGDKAKALDLQFKYFNLVNALFREVNPMPLKAALKLMGYNGCAYRAPLIEVSDATLKVLETEMKKVNLIK